MEPYEVYAIKYATLARTAAENFIGGDPHDTSMRLDYYVWFARNAARTVMIDTGFSESAGRRRKRQLLRPPVESLKLLGVDAGEVRDVIITHLHYDHVGNFDLFPQASFHLQDLEMSYATGRHMAIGHFAYAYEVEEVVGMVRRVYQGRVAFHDGDAEIAPGLTVHHIGGHTLGLQSVRVWTRVGWVVLASDASHYYEHFEKGRCFPTVYNVGDTLEGYNILRRLAESPQHIVPGHDPLVMSRYPAASNDLEGIAVQLDVMPRGA